jgi:cell division protease FtsH
MSKQASTPPPGDKPTPGKTPPPPPAWRHSLLPLALVVAFFLWIFLSPLHGTSSTNLTFTQFQNDLKTKTVKTVDIPQGTGTASGTLKNGTNFTVTLPSPQPDSLATQLTASGAATSYSAPSAGFGSELLSWLILLLPIALFGWLFFRLSRGAAGGGAMGGVLGVGRSRAKVFDEERPSTTFADVAGYDGAKAEISEVVDFLRRPERFARAGAVVPRGVLMVGPPGTGKTLLARAVAGEANVPFFSVSGSGFVELFVGVGAARVRDLFSEARKRAPSIIFIDEIDAIGQRRAGSGAVVSNDEREQTLNQLLAEMDGFDPAAGVVVLGATNRPEVLDPALLRPGRFDRQVTIPLPNVSERAAILQVHVRDKKLAPDVDLTVVARGTPGFSGADLANLANEAAIFAVRDNRHVITADDFFAARDRVILGRREGSNVLLPEEKHAVAVHESGHALVAALAEHADPVAKVRRSASPSSCRWSNGTCTGRTTCTTRLPSGSAAGQPSSSSSARVRPARATTWPGRPTWPPRWSASSACRPSSGRSGIRRAGRCSSAAAGRACPAARTPRRPRRRSTARSPSCSGRPRPARWRSSPTTGPSSTPWSPSCRRRRRSTAGTSTGWPAARTSRPGWPRRRWWWPRTRPRPRRRAARSPAPKGRRRNRNLRVG